MAPNLILFVCVGFVQKQKGVMEHSLDRAHFVLPSVDSHQVASGRRSLIVARMLSAPLLVADF